MRCTASASTRRRKNTGNGIMKIERCAYKGWQHCLYVSNGVVKLIITLDVGPRIIRFGFVGGDNQFCEFRDQLGKTGGNEWRIYACRATNGAEVVL
jgi:hypothetical protein